MERVSRFEDLLVWRKARKLTARLYSLSAQNSLFLKDYAFCNQIRRAAVSVMSNIAEGFDRAYKAEYCQFLAIAKGSCAEVRSQLYVASDIGYLTATDFDELKSLTEEISRMLGGLQTKIKKSSHV